MKHGQANEGESGGIFLNLIILLCLMIFCAFLYLVRRPILRFAAEMWIVEDPLDKADALIVLGDDNFYADRSTRGAQLFREGKAPVIVARSEEHTSELQSQSNLVCRLLLEKKKQHHSAAHSHRCEGIIAAQREVLAHALDESTWTRIEPRQPAACYALGAIALVHVHQLISY